MFVWAAVLGSGEQSNYYYVVLMFSFSFIPLVGVERVIQLLFQYLPSVFSGVLLAGAAIFPAGETGSWR